jgi:hypothetical protein
LDSGEDAVGICGPDEGFGSALSFQDEAVDGGLEIVDDWKTPPMSRLGGCPASALIGQNGRIE